MTPAHGRVFDAWALPAGETENARLVQDAGLTTFVDRFRDTQEAFQQLVRRRQNADATDDLPTLRPTRDTIRELLALSHSVISFLARIEPNGTEPAVRALNERVQDIVTPAKSRRTRQANEAVEEVPVGAAAE